jgi:hypothetical protein
MQRSILFILGVLIFAVASYSDGKPILVFDGVNGYPSTGDSTYKIEIFVAGSGIISEIKTYSDGGKNVTDTMKVDSKGDKILGVCQTKKSRTIFEFTLMENRILRHIIVYDVIKNTIYSDKTSVVVIAPRPGIVFETDSRRFTQASPGDFKVFDIMTNEHLYTFKKNTAMNEGWYRSDWKTVGGKTTVLEFQTMEKNSEWIDAGHGVFIGSAFNRKDTLTNVLNFCILDVLFLNNPIFIPFIFGLKTGSY